MADTRLPDVVPTNKESGDIAIGTSSFIIMNDSETPPFSSTPIPPPLVVQIWTNSETCIPAVTGTPPGSPIPPESSMMVDRRVSSHSSQYHSDSGIDSLLPSPTVLGHHHKQKNSFAMDLSAHHLTVPYARPLLTSQQDGLAAVTELSTDRATFNDDERQSGDEGDSVSAGNGRSSSPNIGFHPQKRNHKNFLPVDYGLTTDLTEPGSPDWKQRTDHYLKVHSLPVEAVFVTDECSLTDDGQRSTCSNEEDYSEHQYLPGGSFSSSRQPSFTSIRSEFSGTLQDGPSGGSAGKGSRHHPLSRSSSSRSTFLSVPRVGGGGGSSGINSVFLSPEHPERHRREAMEAAQRRPSLGSQAGGSLSSLMASRFSLSKSLSPSGSQYIRLAMADCGMNEMLARRSGRQQHEPSSIISGDFSAAMIMADNGLLMMDEDPCYEPSAAATLSLTQRLAFPQLVQADANGLEAGRDGGGKGFHHHQRDHRNNQEMMPREESSLNFFAKIITFLVLVFVIVLVVGVLVKSSHQPR